MSEHQPHSINGGQSAAWLWQQISTVAILAVLVAIAGLMYSLNRKLDTLGQAATAAPPTAPAPLPAPAPAAPLAVAPTPAPAPRPAVTRNYTRPARETSAAIPPHDHTVDSVATAQPAPIVSPAPSVAPAPVAVVQPAAPFPPAQAAVPAPRPARASLPTGSILTVRMIHSLSSDSSRPGDRFAASLDEPIYANGVMAVPAGAAVEGHVVRADQAGRVAGLSELSVQLTRLQLPSGESVSLATDVFSQQGEASRGKDMAKVGVGAAIGAAIGAISGGRKGAGIGAATGAGAAGAEVLLSRGKPAVLTPETRLSFSLAAPVEFDVAGYTQSTSTAATPNNVAPVWPAPRYDTDPFAGERPRLRRRM